MKNKQAEKNVEAFYANLHIHINNIAVNFGMESIHQFRVEYKMMRAFLRLITKQYKIPGELFVSKKLKKCYHISGSIRDLQLQNKRILKVSKKNTKQTFHYRHLLQTEIINLKPQLIELFLSNPIQSSIRKTAAAIPAKFSNQAIYKFIRKKWSVVFKIILSKNLNDIDIHTIRKHLKDLFYNMGLLEGFEDAVLGACIWPGKDSQYLENLLELLGKYQDKCIAIALLKPGWLNRLPAPDYEFITEQNKIWMLEKIQLKQELTLQLKTGLNFLPGAQIELPTPNQ